MSGQKAGVELVQVNNNSSLTQLKADPFELAIHKFWWEINEIDKAAVPKLLKSEKKEVHDEEWKFCLMKHFSNHLNIMK
ncbi:MAG: hypothetical protein LAT67_14885 [Balneolales bacterium]|nr:hypothetical protein [Balneolales bacterium]